MPMSGKPRSLARQGFRAFLFRGLLFSNAGLVHSPWSFTRLWGSCAGRQTKTRALPDRLHWCQQAPGLKMYQGMHHRPPAANYVPEATHTHCCKRASTRIIMMLTRKVNIVMERPTLFSCGDHMLLLRLPTTTTTATAAH